MPQYEIERSAACEQDLIEIWLHVALDSPAAADRLLDRIEQSWDRLRMFPLSGAERGAVRDGVRAVAYGNYVSFYRLEGSTVTILRVRHGKRNTTADDIGG